jgi:hypothetical protein
MNKALIIVVILFVSASCFSQEVDKTLPPTVAAVFDNQLGDVTGFTFYTSYGAKSMSYKVEGNGFNSLIIKQINSGKLERISITKINGLVNGENIRLNPIVLEIGSKSTNKIAFPFCISTFIGHPQAVSIDKNNTKMIQKLKGIYKKELLEIHSFTYSFYKRGEAISIRYSGPDALDNLERLIAQRRNGESILLTNMLYKRGTQQVKGTPILLHVFQ